MTYIIAEPCIGVKDGICADVCPVDCIHTGPEHDMYFIDPDECIDCGVCVPECPVDAIFPDEDLPEKWIRFTDINGEGSGASGAPVPAVPPAPTLSGSRQAAPSNRHRE